MPLFYAPAEERTSLTGEAELSYVKFDAKADDPLTGEQSKFGGDSFAQKYSITWANSNLFYRTQPRYHNVSLGYDWFAFDTKTFDGSTETSLKDVFGKLRYSGEVGFNPVNMPIRVRLHANDSQPITFRRDLGQYGLVNDNLVTTIEGRGKSESYGATFTFEPDLARSTAFRGLPRLHLDYREGRNKSLANASYQYDNTIKELAVAGLSKYNNWVHFRTYNYEDFVDKSNSFDQQQLQVGLVDPGGRRLWSSLTNWIEVSADGQLTNRRAVDGFEEYDVNFMAIATRRNWNARTFMNYNRNLSVDGNRSETELIESARIPVYIKGIYGPETDWYMRASAERGTQTLYKTVISKESSYSNTVAVGGTTFKRSDFTLSPYLSATTSKGFGGEDALGLVASLETNSTARYSNKVGLAAREEFRYNDDGYDTQASKTWHNTVNLKANYRPDSKFGYSLNEFLVVADASPSAAIAGYSGTKHYLETTTIASISWTPNAALSSSLEGSYNLRMNEDNASTNETLLSHRLSYDKKETIYRLNSKYTQRDNYSGSGWEFTNTGDFQYRPDRYKDATLRYIYTKNEYNSIGSSRMELIEKYDYNFFARAGVLRKLATLSQELGYTSEGGTAFATRSSHYLLVSGRYSPTERLSLYGAVKYANSNPGSVAIYYNAGLNADFKLLSTSLDYALAKRDSDNRIEKRFSASVRRTF